MKYIKLFAVPAALALLFVHAAVAQSVPPTAVAATQIANPYGLAALWRQGDFIGRGTLVVLAVMSFGTWYILITKLAEQSQFLAQARAAGKLFWKARTVQEGAAALQGNSPFSAVATAGINALDHHAGTLVASIDLATWVTLSIQRVVDRFVGRLQGGLAVLATVGSTAPFIGLFGTVWGIYHALIAIGIAGQASIDKVAGPVGESLIMTALGLFTAVPAVLGYNWLVRRNKLAVEQLRGFANDLHSVLLSGKVPGRVTEVLVPSAGPRPVALARSA